MKLCEVTFLKISHVKAWYERTYFTCEKVDLPMKINFTCEVLNPFHL